MMDHSPHITSYQPLLRRYELQSLEELVVKGQYMSGHTYLLRDLVAKYPVEFVQYMIRWKDERMEGHHSAADEYFPRIRERVDVLYNRYQELKERPSRSSEEKTEFSLLKNQLQELLYWEIKPEGYTHFLDYDQCCEFDVEYGLIKIAYRIQEGRLHLHKYDTRQEREFRVDVPLAEGLSIEKEQLLHYLADWLSYPGNFAGEPIYVHSDIIPEKEFTDLQEAAHRVYLERIARARGQGASSALVRLCTEYGLEPEPDTGTMHGWLAVCPSGRPHPILLSTQSETWGCGYCRRKGGLKELEDWLFENGRSRKIKPQ